MPILQFRCLDCSAVFEENCSPVGKIDSDIFCLNCESRNIARLNKSFFYANKTFCPHDKEVEVSEVKGDFAGILSDFTSACAGCGVDGPVGNCSSKKGKCGNCTCGKGGCSNRI